MENRKILMRFFDLMWLLCQMVETATRCLAFLTAANGCIQSRKDGISQGRCLVFCMNCKWTCNDTVIRSFPTRKA
ncbi:hypothetical protein V8B55DRAFT_1077630 [Mucor lusitanicus]|uniref:Secreted protein n=1 Tax=Mucor circinelloides f. lusitanicus TaxID=29924 RepID=A0A8H4BNS0_MUCCL|nr:hypothetical protein FB192DRAFT_1359746 [Mucor lusitanicus]